MLYQKMIAENLGIEMTAAEKIMEKMCIAGFRFSSSSEETIISEAKFLLKYCM